MLTSYLSAENMAHGDQYQQQLIFQFQQILLDSDKARSKQILNERQFF